MIPFKLLFLSNLIFFLSFKTTGANIKGRVKDAETKEPLSGVTVFIPEMKIGTITDIEGYFIINIKEAAVISFSYVGYEHLQKKVAFQTTLLNIELKAKKKELNEVTISSKSSDHFNSTQSSIITLNPKHLSGLPAIGGEKDIVRTLQMLPGIKKGGDGAAGMYVRGGNADQNLVLLDGITVYNPSHAIGFFSVFNNDVIKEVKLWKGSFPASYGGRISSVMDVSVNNGNTNKWSTEIGAGILSSKISIQGPLVKDKLSILVGVRRTYLEQLLSVTGIHLPYYFYDVNLKLFARLNPKNTLTLSHYLGNDVLNIIQSGDEQNKSLSIDFGTSLSNKVLVANWIYTGSNFKNHVVAGYSSYGYDIDAMIKQSRFTLSSFISDFTLKSNAVARISVKSSISYGIEYSRIWMRPNYSTINGNLNEKLRQSEGQKFGINLTSVYISHETEIFRNLGLNYGVRLSSSFDNSFAYMIPEPRLNLIYRWSETLNLKVSYNRMSQYLHQVSGSSALLPTDLWYPVSKNIMPLQSHQFSFTINKKIKDTDYSIETDLYYKYMMNLVEYREGTQLLLNDEIEKDLIQGKGRSYGIETGLHKNAGKLKGWIAYTLSWSERQFDELNNGEYFYSRYDRRHDVSIVSTYDFNKRFSISAIYVWATGSRVTPMTGQFVIPSGSYNEILTLPVYGKRNSLVLSSSHRLDLNLVIRSKPGRKYESELHIGAYNVYNQTQPYNTKVMPDGNGNLVYKQIGLFGFIPSLLYQIKF